MEVGLFHHLVLILSGCASPYTTRAAYLVSTNGRFRTGVATASHSRRKRRGRRHNHISKVSPAPDLLLSALPTLTYNISIYGLGPSNTFISGNHICRVFDISSNVTCLLAGITITDGLAPPLGSGFPPSGEPGHGIRNAGILTLTNSKFSTTGTGTAGPGGGISSTGNLHIYNCKVNENLSYAGAAISSSGVSSEPTAKLPIIRAMLIRPVYKAKAP